MSVKILCVLSHLLPRQQAPPLAYDPQEYGPWPARGAWVIKARMPPSWKSTFSPANYHTVTLLLAHERDPRINPLLQGPGMEQLLDSNCDCRAGIRTNCSCCHRDCLLELLAATACLDSAKVPEALLVDTIR